MHPVDFVRNWTGVTRTERSAAQEHFLQLCRVLGQPTPAEVDKDGSTYTFEKGAAKSTGGQGWADVWYRGHFAWEYKGPGRDLDKACDQLLRYKDHLENPPLLVVSDLDRIVIRTNVTDCNCHRDGNRGRSHPPRRRWCACDSHVCQGFWEILHNDLIERVAIVMNPKRGSV